MKKTTAKLAAEMKAAAKQSASREAGGMSWVRLQEILDAAKQDKYIAEDNEALKFLNDVYELVDDMTLYQGRTARDAWFYLKKEVSDNAKKDALRGLNDKGRHKGGETLKQRAENHKAIISGAVIDLLTNQQTFDWSDGAIADFLMTPPYAFHKHEKIEVKRRTMVDRVKQIRAAYKASKLTS